MILHIAQKDARIYFFKGPNLTFGLLMPVVLYWAFAIDREVDAGIVLPGLVAMALLFGAGAIQGVALPLERRTGTIERLLVAPVTPFMLMLAKALAGTFFGLALAVLYMPVILYIGTVEILITPFLFVSLFCSFCFSLFGLLMAIPFHDIPQAMPPATVVRIALVFISGTFSAEGPQSRLLYVVARAMPMVYGVNGLRQAMSGMPDARAFVLDLVFLALFSLVFLGVATWLFRAQHN